MSDVFGVGQATSGIAQAAAMITVAALQYKTWDKQIDKADAIARRIQDRADENHALWRDFYLDKELRTVNELDAAPIRVASYGAVRQRVEAQYRVMLDRAEADALYCLDDQCVGARCDITREMALRGAALTSYGVEAAFRAEDARVELLNRQRIADRLTVLAHGRQVHHASTAQLTAAIQQSQFAAQQAAGAFNGAMQSLGALARRREQAVTRREPAPVEVRDITRGNPLMLPDPRADENGYGAFPQQGSGDAGFTPAAYDMNFGLEGLSSAPLAVGSDPISSGPGDSNMDTADYGGSI